MPEQEGAGPVGGFDAMVDRTTSSQKNADNAFGEYLRTQRHIARLSLRQLAGMAKVSDAYLSQLERGLHLPSVGVIRALAESLQLSTEALLAQAAGVKGDPPGVDTEDAIRADPKLDSSQKSALLTVYRSMIGNRP
jgi:transcriptional regulator with XRE-family HTH domain